MPTNKFASSALTLLLGSVLLASCGAGVPQAPATTEAPAASAPATSAPSAPGTSLEEQVIYGTASSIQQRPYQVALLYNGNQFCGGTMISKDWILTAAHCFDGMPGLGGLQVRAGSSYSTSGGQLIQASQVITHSSYRNVQTGYDVALVRLASPITISTAQPALIPTAAVDSVATAPGRSLTISGFGRTSPYNNYPSAQLREANLPVLSYDECDSQMAFMLGNLYLANGTVCGGVNQSGQSGCQGDSGGPFATRGDNGRYYVFGIVSWGSVPNCNNAPTAFTRVASYNSWIQSKTGIAPSN